MTAAVAGCNPHNADYKDDQTYNFWLIPRGQKKMRNIDALHSVDGLPLFVSPQCPACQSSIRGNIASGASSPVNVRFSGGGAAGERLLLVTLKESSVSRLGAINIVIWAMRDSSGDSSHSYLRDKKVFLTQGTFL